MPPDDRARRAVRKVHGALFPAAAAIERLLNSAVVPFGNAEIPVHASLGVATFGAGDEAADIVTRADAAMYRKKQGKPPVLRAWRVRRD